MLKLFNYDESEIGFRNENGVVMVNATQMAKSFNKDMDAYLRLANVTDYIKALISYKCLETNDPNNERVVENEVFTKIFKTNSRGGTKTDVFAVSEYFPNVVSVVKGGNVGNITQGTWLCEELALHFAQWLSPRFHLWCNTKVKELLIQGVTTLDNSNVELLKESIKKLENQIDNLQGKADYADRVLLSEDCYTTTEIAKHYNMSAIALHKLLESKKVIFKDEKQWFVRSSHHNKNLCQNRITPYIDKKGRNRSYQTTVWTENGRVYIDKIVSKNT